MVGYFCNPHFCLERHHNLGEIEKGVYNVNTLIPSLLMREFAHKDKGFRRRGHHNLMTRYPPITKRHAEYSEKRFYVLNG
jgi:hypothetical protein